MSGTDGTTGVNPGHLSPARSRLPTSGRSSAARVGRVDVLLLFGPGQRLLGDCVASALVTSGLTVERLERGHVGGVEARRYAVVLVESAVLDDSGDSDLIDGIHEFGVNVLIIATDPSDMSMWGQCGADGFVAATEDLRTLVAAVRRLVDVADIERDHRCPSSALGERAPDDLLASLSPREQTVLKNMMRGLSAAEIADVQFVAVSTVRSQIRAVLTKLNVRSQLAAVALAHRAAWNADPPRNHQF